MALANRLSLLLGLLWLILSLELIIQCLLRNNKYTHIYILNFTYFMKYFRLPLKISSRRTGVTRTSG
jgi:hypothetical protein